jgi:chemotaxis protein methyltransferase CheR
MGNWDVIFCRNVTIYFRLESTRRVVANFYDSLNEGGYLFIGHSETLTSINDRFEPVEVDGVFLYRKPVTRRGFSLGQVHPAASRSSRSARIGRQSARRQAESVPAAAAGTRELAPTDPLDEARAALADGRPERVLSIVGQVLAEYPNNADAHLLSAYLHADAGDYDEAMRAAHRALAVNPLLPVAHYVLGIIHQRQGDTVRAVSELKKTIYVDPDFALAHLNLANLYKAQRAWDLAAQEYENALKSLRSSPEGMWTEFSGGFRADLLARTVERSLAECRRAAGGA